MEGKIPVVMERCTTERIVRDTELNNLFNTVVESRSQYESDD